MSSSSEELVGFLGLAPELRDKNTAKVVVVPVPFEASTSYGKGTADAPDAIIEASHQVEFFDEELHREPCSIGIYTEDPIGTSDDWDHTADALSKKAASLAKAGKFPLFLGGEHSITAPLVRGVAEVCPDVSVLHLDAHADLRYEYLDNKWSHACVMRRIFEMNIPFCSVGIRSFSQEEFDLITQHNIPVFYAHTIRDDANWMDKVIGSLGKNVYLTFDIDAVDISEVRATGTPEPGGLVWTQIIPFLRKLSASGRRFIGADLVELAPSSTDHTSSFYAARLAYKIIGYLAS